VESLSKRTVATDNTIRVHIRLLDAATHRNRRSTPAAIYCIFLARVCHFFPLKTE
jgi:hypothetical protein